MPMNGYGHMNSTVWFIVCICGSHVQRWLRLGDWLHFFFCWCCCGFHMKEEDLLELKIGSQSSAGWPNNNHMMSLFLGKMHETDLTASLSFYPLALIWKSLCFLSHDWLKGLYYISSFVVLEIFVLVAWYNCHWFQAKISKFSLNNPSSPLDF